MQKILSQQIGVKTRWLPFCKLQFQIHFLVWKNYHILIKISLKFVAKHPVNNKYALGQIMAWHLKDNKLLSEPMLAYFTEAYMCHMGSMS